MRKSCWFAFLCIITLHLKLAHHWSSAILAVQYLKRLSNINVLKKKTVVDFYSGRELADWSVEWWGGWLSLHYSTESILLSKEIFLTPDDSGLKI